MKRKFTVKFSDVGAQKKTWEERIDAPITDRKMVNAIKRRGALMSREIDFGADSDYAGPIYVGMLRRVGYYSIVPLSDAEVAEARP